MNENKKVLSVIDEALKEYGSDILSVDRDSEDGKMIHVNLCGGNWSDAYMLNVAHFNKCNIKELEKELDKRHVGHCW